MDIYLKLNLIKNNNQTIPHKKIEEKEIIIPFKEDKFIVALLDIKDISLKTLDSHPKFIMTMNDGKKYESNLGDDQYPLSFPFVFTGIAYLVKYTYCIKINDNFYEIKTLNIDLISLEEIYDITNKLGKIYLKIISFKNLKQFLSDKNFDNIELYSFIFSPEDKLLKSIKFIIELLQIDITKCHLEDLYIKLLQEMSNIIQNSLGINSKKLQEFIIELKERVITKINEIFVENSKRVEQIINNSFKPSNGEFILFYRNIYDNSVKKGNIKLIGFDENALPIITMNSEKMDKSYYLEEKKYKDLNYCYNQIKNELRDYWNEELSDLENVEILKKECFAKEKIQPQMIELNESMTREQRDAYAYHNSAIARGIVKAEPSIQEKVDSLIEYYEIMFGKQ